MYGDMFLQNGKIHEALNLRAKTCKQYREICEFFTVKRHSKVYSVFSMCISQKSSVQINRIIKLAVHIFHKIIHYYT